MNWWQKGIGLSILWIALMIGVMFLDNGANNDQIAERYGQVCGMVLVLGWSFAVVSRIGRWKQG